MREIKFMAWDGVGMSGPWDLTSNLSPNYWNGKTPLQFTGLKDKNGKEIYEGNIVHYRYIPGSGMWNYENDAVISWVSTGFHMKPLKNQGGINGWLVSVPGAYGGTGESNKLFEVIGNIYENPELLK